ncbi:predicted protein [Chaetoceros tenuissimus]|uniref:Uncharacterized protein n=1 Tax=Chaetoceros tenuissimus TaxID=426638 RepID=A0AAD3CQP0_9STRA|nr:predicted protein [Chaetoceros tenuissimus]
MFVSHHQLQDKKPWCLSGSESASRMEKMWAKQQFKEAFGIQAGLVQGTPQAMDVKALTELAMQSAALAAVAAVQQISPGKQSTTAGPTE